MSDLIYKLVTWVPDMQDDIEGLVYLELVLRTVTQAARFSAYGANIVFRNQTHEQGSVKAAIWDIFVPLADGAVEIDEDLLETLPTDVVNILSIHQAKGLEYPLTILDVGSDFRSEHPQQAFKRFPANGSVSHQLEDELRQFSSTLNAPSRTQVDRAFDDLIRAYFVGYSRVQDVLLLVGHENVITGDGIRNVATGWDRSEAWRWGPGMPHIQMI